MILMKGLEKGFIVKFSSTSIVFSFDTLMKDYKRSVTDDFEFEVWKKLSTVDVFLRILDSQYS